MASRVHVKPELIRWAIERSGKGVAELAQALPNVSGWRDGTAQPAMRQLEQLAHKTWTPLGYFFLPEPPQEPLPVPDFRTVADRVPRRPSPNLLDTLYLMQRRQQWLREELMEGGAMPLQFVGALGADARPADVAALMRQALGMGAGWASRVSTWTDALYELRAAAENLGIFVVINGVVGNNTSRPLDPAEFRGFVLNDSYAPLVFLNGADARSAQLFTLAHELAHLWIGEGALFNLDFLGPPDNQRQAPAVERFCNDVAAEFLVPAPELRPFWRTASLRPEPFAEIARRFRVSPIVGARRALDLRLTTRSEFLRFLDHYRADERRQAAHRRSGGDFYNSQNLRIGKRFATMVMRAAKEGKLAYQAAYDLTGLHGATFDRYAKRLGLAY